MCQHDPTYQIENEANGGAGCPKCRAALQAAAAEVGVTAEWMPAPSTAEMIRITREAFENQPPIEY